MPSCCLESDSINDSQVAQCIPATFRKASLVLSGSSSVSSSHSRWRRALVSLRPRLACSGSKSSNKSCTCKHPEQQNMPSTSGSVLGGSGVGKPQSVQVSLLIVSIGKKP